MNVAFLTGALLAGLGVLVVPTLIHLISKRRARRVRFAPVELLLRSRRRTARNIRLRQLLLLLLRTLLFACAALAVAQPVLRASQAPATTGAPLVVVVAVDASASMHTVIDGRTMFARAKAEALDVLRAEPADVRVAAVACEAEPRDLAAPTFDGAAVADAVSRLQPGYARADLTACVGRAASLARSVEVPGAAPGAPAAAASERRVIVLSDLAAHAFSAGGAAGEASGVVVEWRRVSPEAPPPNHALTAVDVTRTMGRSGDAVEVSFTAERFEGPSVDVTADLIVGLRRAARLSLTMAGGDRVQRKFHHVLADPAAPATTPPEVDAGRLTVQLADDALALDNQVPLPFELPPAMRVVVVDGAPQTVPFRDEVFYLESALRGGRSSGGRLQVEVVGPDQLRPDLLAGARVVVLANVARFEPAAAAALVEHVKAGGGLFMTMGDQVDVEAWNRALGAVLPAPLRGTKGQALLDDASVAEVLSLTRFRAEHPVLRGLASGDDLPGLGRVRTHTLMLLEPSPSSQTDVVMRFSNDAPALLERPVGDGRAMLLATTIDRDWSDLAIRPGFLPLVRQIVLYLGGALDEGGPRILRVGEPRKIRVARGTSMIEVEQPGGPRVSLAVDDAVPELTFRQTTAPGLYRVFARAENGEPREKHEEHFTVVIDPAESDPTLAEAELLEQATPAGAATRTRDAGNDDVPLWPYLLLAAVVLVLLESLLLRRRHA